MKNKLIIKILCLMLTLCFTVNTVSGNLLIKNTDNLFSDYLESDSVYSSYESIIESLNDIIYPLNSSALELSDEDLHVLSYLDDSKIVGLGEATHGTKEFFQMKHRIFKFLVENYEFKIFAFECDMGESYYIDNFVTNGEGDIDSVMDKMLFWTWHTKEVKDLLVWMKEYNENRSEQNKIHFIGVDCQFMKYQAEIIMNYFNKTNLELSNFSIQFLNEIDLIGHDTYNYYLEGNVNLSKKLEIDYNVDQLIDEIQNLKHELINASSDFEYYFIEQLSLNIKQVNDVLFGFVHGDSYNYRDLYMANNTLWSSDLFGENTKVVLWAHNGHVSNLEEYGSIGFHLKQELQERYQIVGFSFSLGSFMAIRMSLIKLIPSVLLNFRIWRTKYGSINYVFHQARYDNFILRAEDIEEQSDFDKFISNTHQFLQIGAGFNRFLYIIGVYFFPIKLMDEFDVIIHWDRTKAAEQLY